MDTPDQIALSILKQRNEWLVNGVLKPATLGVLIADTIRAERKQVEQVTAAAALVAEMSALRAELEAVKARERVLVEAMEAREQMLIKERDLYRKTLDDVINNGSRVDESLAILRDHYEQRERVREEAFALERMQLRVSFEN